MAAGFFCVTGLRHLELRLKSRPDDGVEGVVVDVQVMGLFDPLTQVDIGGAKPAGCRNTCSNAPSTSGGSDKGLPAGTYSAIKAFRPPAS